MLVKSTPNRSCHFLLSMRFLLCIVFWKYLHWFSYMNQRNYNWIWAYDHFQIAIICLCTATNILHYQYLLLLNNDQQPTTAINLEYLWGSSLVHRFDCNSTQCNAENACIRPTSHTIFLHIIEIKRYCNKKMKRHFHPIFFSCVNWKYLFLDNYAYWNLVWKYFEMSLQYFDEKNIFSSKIFLSFYRNIVWKNIVCDIGLNVMCT